MKKLLGLAWILGLAGSMAACSDDDQDVTPGGNGEAIALTVHLVQDGQDKGSKDIRSLADRAVDVAVSVKNKDTGVQSTEQRRGIRGSYLLQQVLGLSDAQLEEFLGKYLCEFQSNKDGMKPSDKMDKETGVQRCPPVSCTNLKHTYFDVMSGNVFYDDQATTQLGCYQVGMVSDAEAGTNPVSGQKYSSNLLVITPKE